MKLCLAGYISDNDLFYEPKRNGGIIYTKIEFVAASLKAPQR